MTDRLEFDGDDLTPDRRPVDHIEMTASYHDQRLRRLKRNPVFRWHYWWQLRKARRLNREARAYAERLVASGHCPRHLVKGCSCQRSGDNFR